MDFIRRYIEEAKPHVQTIGERAQATGERIIARLDRIAEAVESEEFDEHRRRCQFTTTAGAERVIAEVPTTQEWVLESLSLIPGAAGGAFVMRESGQLRYAFAVASPATITPDLVFGGGSRIAVTFADGAEGYAQFKVKRHKPKTAARNAGQADVAPFGPSDARTDASKDGRHAGPGVFHGPNPIAGRAA